MGRTWRHGKLLSDPKNALEGVEKRGFNRIPSETSSGWWFGTFFIFPYIGNVIIPIDFHIFQRGGEKPPTSHWDDPKNELMGSIDDKTVDF